MNSADLIATVRHLISREGGATEADARRAISTLYYAMFHALAKSCADNFAGEDDADRGRYAWRQVYRSLAHTKISDRCRIGWFRDSDFPQAIKKFGADFVELQDKRHRCDYDPFYEPVIASIEADVKQIERTILEFENELVRHRRAFSIWVLFESKTEDRKPIPSKKSKKKGIKSWKLKAKNK